MNLCEILLRQAQERADEIAIIEPHRQADRTITFGGLEERTGRAAQLLANHGLRKDDRVLLLQPISIELYVALLAVLRIGGAVTLIDPSAGTGHLEAGLARARPRAFIGSPRAHLLRLVRRSLRRLRPAFTTGAAWPGLIGWKEMEGLSPTGIEPRGAEDAALITFTSGSTGVPKAAVRSHGFLLAQHAALERAIDLKAGEIDLATLPVFVLANLASGVTTLLANADLRRPGEVDPEPIFRQLARYRPTRSEGSPAFYERLLATPASSARTSPRRPLVGFEKLFTGGAPVFPRLLGRLQQASPEARIVAVYGSTEAEPIAHVDWDAISPADLERMYSGGGLLTGEPVPEIELRIVTFPPRRESVLPRLSGEEFARIGLAPNAPGEIVVHGEHVIASYLDGIGDEETKFEVDGARWHRTGDSGYLDDEGRLWLLGRTSAAIDDERGVLHPFSVECAASRFGRVRRSALVARNGERILVVERVTSEETRRERVTPEETRRERGLFSETPRERVTSRESRGERVRGSGDEASDEPGALVEALSVSLTWAQLDRVLVVPRIPVDRRHNAKVDYVALEALLSRT